MSARLEIIVTTAVLAGTLVLAQDAPPNTPDARDPNDAPGRAAQLSYLSGTVSFQAGGVEEWTPARLNRPLTTGDRLWTEGGSRAELHIGSAAIRLNGRTNFQFVNLNDDITQIQISTGVASVRIRRLDERESFEIDTPQAAFSLLRPGEYRVDVDEQGAASIVTVRGGEGEVTANGQAFPVRAREQVRISGTEGSGQPVFDRRDAPVGDGFDNFCEDRDRREDRSESARHMSRDIPGYADLDANGGWRQEPDYGWVWAPRVAAGWAPYRYGHWAWIEPWGWTWVDDAPWGYAPFHYGRWAFAGAAWVWVPGPIAVRPVYAPALVAWVGGANFGVGISIGGPAVGWFPLGPREVFVPAYRSSPRYITQVNVTNTVIVNRTVINNVNVTNVNYVNRSVAGAVTAVPQGAMVAGRPVAAAAVVVPPAAVARAQVSSYAAVAPQRAAVLGGAAPVSAAPPPAVMNRTVVARTTPPPAPVPFAQRQTALQSNPGRPVEPPALNQMRVNQPQAPRALYRPAMPQAQTTPQNTPQLQPQIPQRGTPGQNTLGQTVPRPNGPGQNQQNTPAQTFPRGNERVPIQAQPSPPTQNAPVREYSRPNAQPQNPPQPNPPGQNPQVFRGGPQNNPPVNPPSNPQERRVPPNDNNPPQPAERQVGRPPENRVPEGRAQGNPPPRSEQKQQRGGDKREERRQDKQ
jgi:hypothetical protein